jgi:exodeoxyribonuclease-5
MNVRSDLPLLPLNGLEGGAMTVVLCATSRLASGLRRAHGAVQASRGAASWQALQTATVSQWLDHVTSAALLRGEIPPASVPGQFLTWPQEHSVWEQAVAADMAQSASAIDLFDREGLARAAMAAESLRAAWKLEVPESLHTEEYRAFQRWRMQVAATCQRNEWSTADAVLGWRIGCIARGVSGLPLRVGIAGFIAPDPWLSRLLLALEARGVELFRVDFGVEAERVSAQECADAEAECQAAGAWARERLVADPAARLRIAVADLPTRRRGLMAALDAALHPQAVGAAWAGVERDYVLATGTPLADVSPVATALALLPLFAHPQSIAQADLGALLCGMGWSADVAEADARARLEAALREVLPPEFSLDRLLRTLARLEIAAAAPALMAHLAALSERVRRLPRRQSPGDWGQAFAEALRVLAWPGQRPLLTAEREARVKLNETLAGLAALDAVRGRIDAAAALRLLRRQCRELAFAPVRQSPPRVEVCSLDDALAEPVTGLWVMGLDEWAWPRAPRPNPLLPAELQRCAGMPDARGDSLLAQAQVMQALWCASADEVVFSWAVREGERELRPSALLAEMARVHVSPLSLCRTGGGDGELESLDDAQAPPVAADERVRGGTALLKAQALCPAWGFYQYRLGAQALPTPVFGLDARARGLLVHAALEAFWRGRSRDAVLAMAQALRHAEIRRVAVHALNHLDHQAIDPLPPRLRTLEQERLERLLASWLELELQRPAFSVIGCEEGHTLDIAGLSVRVTIDRIDRLADGQLVILDYKTGRSATAESWADERITEPQLPIYAALAFPDQPLAAVALARVTPDEAAFVGLAASDGALPGVRSLAAQRKRYDEAGFPDWDSVRLRWAERLRTLAREILDGQAAVSFADEQDVAHCEVRPLLRLAERRAQWDAGEAGEGEA